MRVRRLARVFVWSAAFVPCVAIAAAWAASIGAVDGFSWHAVVNPVAGVMETRLISVSRGALTVERHTRPVGTDPEAVSALATPGRWLHARTPLPPRLPPMRYGRQNVGWSRGRAWQAGWSYTVPLWPAAVATGALPLGLLVAHHYRSRSTRPGLCRACGYDLRASPGRCPECGAVPQTKAGGVTAGVGGNT